jgi:DNA-binding HxlR family transcriptional regulator
MGVMVFQMAGALATRGDVPLGDLCPVERALGLLGNRVTLLLLREVSYGTTRFDALTRRVGVTEAVAARRLRELVDAGVLVKEPYREPGQRTRHEYLLTDSGRELVPVLVGLSVWGARHLAGGGPRITHAGCDEPVRAALVCDAGHRPAMEDVEVRSTRRA